MTAREWQPGDVAVVNGRRALRVGNIGWHLRPCTDKEEQSGEDFLQDKSVTDVRPLVVLDLAEIDEGAATTWGEVVKYLRATGTLLTISIADQIEAQTRPPKPEEPTGLGAVVEDEDGERWIRVDWPQPWCLAKPVLRAMDSRVLHGSHLTYDRINAVRVLSEGVTA